jgi:hypothetical protein
MKLRRHARDREEKVLSIKRSIENHRAPSLGRRPWSFHKQRLMDQNVFSYILRKLTFVSG